MLIVHELLPGKEVEKVNSLRFEVINFFIRFSCPNPQIVWTQILDIDVTDQGTRTRLTHCRDSQLEEKIFYPNYYEYCITLPFVLINGSRGTSRGPYLILYLCYPK